MSEGNNTTTEQKLIKS